MQFFKKRDSLELIEEVLNRERLAILSGNFEALARVVLDKERLLNLPDFPRSKENLMRLKLRIDRNQELLKAALLGIQSATDLMGKQTQNEDRLQTYSDSGQRVDQSAESSNMLRRA